MRAKLMLRFEPSVATHENDPRGWSEPHRPFSDRRPVSGMVSSGWPITGLVRRRRQMVAPLSTRTAETPGRPTKLPMIFDIQ